MLGINKRQDDFADRTNAINSLHIWGFSWIKSAMGTQYFLNRDTPFHERSRFPHRSFATIAFQTIQIRLTVA
jgi:hypothetical protein